MEREAESGGGAPATQGEAEAAEGSALCRTGDTGGGEHYTGGGRGAEAAEGSAHCRTGEGDIGGGGHHIGGGGGDIGGGEVIPEGEGAGLRSKTKKKAALTESPLRAAGGREQTHLRHLAEANPSARFLAKLSARFSAAFSSELRRSSRISRRVQALAHALRPSLHASRSAAPAPGEQSSGKKRSTGHTHTYTHTDREQHPRHQHTHTTRTTPQTPKRTPPPNTSQRSKVNAHLIHMQAAHTRARTHAHVCTHTRTRTHSAPLLARLQFCSPRAWRAESRSGHRGDLCR